MALSPSTAAAPFQRKTILLVDPEREISYVLDQLAAGEDWDVRCIPDNRTALSLAEASSFDLIITGQKTSGSEDVELLRKIRRVRSHVRMIILAGKSTPEDVIAELRNNAFSYFRAPCDPRS